MAIKNRSGVLVDLGFTALEESIYTFLLRESPATGYRIAKAIGKPAANTYKAIDTLAQKGAIVLDDGPRRLCRAVPHEELLALLERCFKENVARAERSLSKLPVLSHDDRIYKVSSRDQVLERARSMLERARKIAVLDLFPGPLKALEPDIVRCAERGVDVTVKAYTPVDIAGVRVVKDYMSTSILERWPGQCVNIVIDAIEHLLAFLTPDGADVYQAVWSGSPYLSSTYHGGIHAEIVLDEIGNLLHAGGTMNDVREAFDRFRRPEMLDSPGYEALIGYYGEQKEQKERSEESFVEQE